MDLDRFFDAEMAEHEEALRAAHTALRAPFAALVAAALRSLKGGGKILFFGNGGSAADAQHLATELTVRYSADRPPLAALALTTDSSALTAIGNDMDFGEIFARQIDALGRPGDLALGISTSGRSRNVVRGLEAARAKGLVAAAFTGGDGGALTAIADPVLCVPSRVTARIQEIHILLGQMLCGAVERELGLVP